MLLRPLLAPGWHQAVGFLLKVIPGKVRKRNADAFAEYAEAFNCAIDAFIQLDEVRSSAVTLVQRPIFGDRDSCIQLNATFVPVSLLLCTGLRCDHHTGGRSQAEGS
jgi:hypothetical protein